MLVFIVMATTLHHALGRGLMLESDESSDEVSRLAVDPADAQRCARGFAGLQFDLRDYDRYPVFFHNQTVGHFYPGGKWFGPKDIEEYFRFTDISSPFVERRCELGETSVSFKGLTPDGLCSFRVARVSKYLASPLASSAAFVLAVGFNFYYDPVANYVDSFQVLYKPEATRFLHGAAHQMAASEYVCRVMQRQCGAVWRLNGYKSVSDCACAINALPTTHDIKDYSSQGTESYSDSKTQSCAVLHSVFAEHNAEHCPHISQVPMEDARGRVKCQVSAETNPDEYFSEADYRWFDDFLLANGIDPRYGYYNSSTLPPLEGRSCDSPVQRADS